MWTLYQWIRLLMLYLKSFELNLIGASVWRKNDIQSESPDGARAPRISEFAVERVVRSPRNQKQRRRTLKNLSISFNWMKISSKLTQFVFIKDIWRLNSLKLKWFKRTKYFKNGIPKQGIMIHLWDLCPVFFSKKEKLSCDWIDRRPDDRWRVYVLRDR